MEKVVQRKNTVIVLITTCLYIIASTISVFADAQHIWTGGLPTSVISDFRYVVSGGTYAQQNIMKAGANAWNGISSKVKLSNNATSAKMNIYWSSSPVNGNYGYCYTWYNDSGTLREDTIRTRVWFCIDAYVYDNQMVINGFNDYQKQSNVTHEVGHALSLAHTNNLPATTYTVMRQGKQQIGPQMEDKNHLKLKWGY